MEILKGKVTSNYRSRRRRDPGLGSDGELPDVNVSVRGSASLAVSSIIRVPPRVALRLSTGCLRSAFRPGSNEYGEVVCPGSVVESEPLNRFKRHVQHSPELSEERQVAAVGWLHNAGALDWQDLQDPGQHLTNGQETWAEVQVYARRQPRGAGLVWVVSRLRSIRWTHVLLGPRHRAGQDGSPAA